MVLKSPNILVQLHYNRAAVSDEYSTPSTRTSYSYYTRYLVYDTARTRSSTGNPPANILSDKHPTRATPITHGRAQAGRQAGSMSIAKAATATAAELSSMTRRRSSLTRRGSFMGKTVKETASSTVGSAKDSTATSRPHTVAGGDGGGGGRRGTASGGGGGGSGGHTTKPSASARSAEASRKIVRDTVRAQAPREDGG